MTRADIEKRLLELGAEKRVKGIYHIGESFSAELWDLDVLALNTISNGKIVSSVMIDFPAVRGIRRRRSGRAGNQCLRSPCHCWR